MLFDFHGVLFMVAMEWNVVGAELDSESFLILDGGVILIVEVIETV